MSASAFVMVIVIAHIFLSAEESGKE